MNQFRTHFDKQTALRDNTLDSIATANRQLADKTVYVTELEEAREIVTAVLMATQLDAKKQIESIVTLLLQSVFGHDLRFEIEYRDLRGKSEAEFYLIKGASRRPATGADSVSSVITPPTGKKRGGKQLGASDKTPEGTHREPFTKNLPQPGGINDICALGLRLACWALSSPRLAPVILLDEPAKYIHGKETMERLGDALKHICKELGLQIIMVGADDEIASTADRVFEVRLKGNESIVELRDGESGVVQ